MTGTARLRRFVVAFALIEGSLTSLAEDALGAILFLLPRPEASSSTFFRPGARDILLFGLSATCNVMVGYGSEILKNRNEEVKLTTSKFIDALLARVILGEGTAASKLNVEPEVNISSSGS